MKCKFGFICCLLFVVVGLTYVHYKTATQWIIKAKNQIVAYQTPRLFKFPNSETVKMKIIQGISFKVVHLCFMTNVSFHCMYFHFLSKFQLTFWLLFFSSNKKATFEPQGPPELELNPVSGRNWSIIIQLQTWEVEQSLLT